MLVKASLPQFCATASPFIAIIVVMTGPYPNAIRSNVNAFRECCGRNGEDCCCSYCEEVGAHKLLHSVLLMVMAIVMAAVVAIVMTVVVTVVMGMAGVMSSCSRCR